MSGFTSFASASGAATNLDQTYESAGWDTSTGTGTVLTANGTNHVKGSYATIINGTASAWAGFWLRTLTSNNSGGRFLVDVSIDGSTALVPNIFLQPSTTGSSRLIDIWLPIQVAAGAHLRARCQCSSGGATLTVTALGIVASSTSQPGFTTATALTTVDTTNTRANTSTINLQGTGATSWSSLVDPLGATYGAILMTASNVSTPSNIQQCRFALATGPTGGGSEVFAGSAGGFMNTSGALLPGVAKTIEKTFASGIRVSGNVQAAAAGTPDTFGIQLIGFS